MTFFSSRARTCGEVRRVTNGTRTGVRPLSESMDALKSFGSLIGLLPGVQSAVLPNSPEVNAQEQDGDQRQDHAMQHVESQQGVGVHRMAAQNEKSDFRAQHRDRKSTRLNSSHLGISYAV